MIQPVLALPDHLAVFERGIASQLDFSFAGPQSRRLADLVAEKRSGSARFTPISSFTRGCWRILCRGAACARRPGRPPGQPLYRPEHRGHADPGRSDGFSDGVVIAQVNEITERSSARRHPWRLGQFRGVRDRRPTRWNRCSPATRRRSMTSQVLMALMAIKGIYAPYEIRTAQSRHRLCHRGD